VSLVVSGALMPPSSLAVTLGCLRVAKHLGGASSLALGPCGPLVPGSGALMLTPTPGALVVVLVIVDHRKSLSGGPSPTGRSRQLGAASGAKR
jgi:hypothetical protein